MNQAVDVTDGVSRVVDLALELQRVRFTQPPGLQADANRLVEACFAVVRALDPVSAHRAARLAESRDLASGIAKLRMAGKGVRQIARELALNPSTVSRRLRSRAN